VEWITHVKGFTPMVARVKKQNIDIVSSPRKSLIEAQRAVEAAENNLRSAGDEIAGANTAFDLEKQNLAKVEAELTATKQAFMDRQKEAAGSGKRILSQDGSIDTAVANVESAKRAAEAAKQIIKAFEADLEEAYKASETAKKNLTVAVGEVIRSETFTDLAQEFFVAIKDALELFQALRFLAHEDIIHTSPASINLWNVPEKEKTTAKELWSLFNKLDTKDNPFSQVMDNYKPLKAFLDWQTALGTNANAKLKQ
jgi:hypothetical protein